MSTEPMKSWQALANCFLTDPIPNGDVQKFHELRRLFSGFEAHSVMRLTAATERDSQLSRATGIKAIQASFERFGELEPEQRFFVEYALHRIRIEGDSCGAELALMRDILRCGKDIGETQQSPELSKSGQPDEIRAVDYGLTAIINFLAPMKQVTLFRTLTDTEEAAQTVLDSLARIAEIWPEMSVEIKRWLRTIAMEGLLGNRLNSFNLRRWLPGVIFVTVDPDYKMFCEESIIHETAHLLLHTINMKDPLVLEKNEKLLIVPWSGNQRLPIDLMHATYVYLLLCHWYGRLYLRNIESDFSWERLVCLAQSFDEAIAVLRGHCKLTDMGDQFLKTIQHENEKLFEDYHLPKSYHCARLAAGSWHLERKAGGKQ